MNLWIEKDKTKPVNIKCNPFVDPDLNELF